MAIEERYCVVDCETWTPSGKVDPNTDELRYVGFKSITGQYRIFHHPSQQKEIQQALFAFPYLVNHNLLEYDCIILERHGYQVGIKGRFNETTMTYDKGSTLIDTLKIMENRAKSMMYLDLNRGQYSLGYLCDYFALANQKGHMDYSLLEKPILEGVEYSEMETYLKQDLDATESLFLFLYDFFFGFRELMCEKDKKRMSWLTCKPGSTSYKIICNKAGLPEEYEDGEIEDLVRYAGGFVSEPYMDFVQGDIYVCDFNSLYPHCFVGGNLYSPTDSDDAWEGSGVFPNALINDMDGVNGRYSRKQGKIEKVIHDIYLARKDIKKQMKSVEYKSTEWNKLDKKSLAYKIVINTAYGISGCPKFKRLYNKTTASDCTALARRAIRNARTMLEKAGYECCYTDTDSVYIKDIFGSRDKLLAITKEIADKQIASFNIPVDTHCFEIESKIKHMYFFRSSKKDEFIKKHYIYVKDDGEIVVKGLKIIQGTVSPLAKLVYDMFIKPKIIAGENIIFSADTIIALIKQQALLHPELLTKRFRVNAPETYANATSIQSQVSKRYGRGEHYLILNSSIGAGKGSRYATVEELKEKFGDDWTLRVKVTKYADDLGEFVNPKERDSIKKLAEKEGVVDDE